MTTAEEEAGRWCVKLAGATFGPAEQTEFDRWMNADPTNRAVFDRALAVWQGLYDIGRSPEIISLRATALETMRRTYARKWSRPMTGKWRQISLAACILALVSAGVFLHGRAPSYQTQIAEHRAVLLEDGSRLSLDAATKVDVDYRERRRDVRLVAGRAKFDVARDAMRPFIVKAGEKTITAIGTAFSVEVLETEVRVILYEGRVAVDDGAGERILEPGSELVAERGQRESRIEPVDLARSLSWESGQLNFMREPLRLAVERINRYSGSTIVVTDETTAAILIDGVFNTGDSAAFVEAVSTAYAVQVREQDGRIVLSGK